MTLSPITMALGGISVGTGGESTGSEAEAPPVAPDSHTGSAT